MTPRRGSWARIALGLVLAVLAAACGGASGEPDQASSGTATEPLLPFTGKLAPGTYFIAEGATAYVSPLRIAFDVPGRGWEAWSAGVVKQGDTPPLMSAVAFADVTNLYADPCRNGSGMLDPPVGRSVEDLAAALQELPGFVVTGPATDVTIDGFAGTYLGLQVDPQLDLEACDGGAFDSWVAPTANRYHQGPRQIEEFWILDVDGTRLVINASHFPKTSPKDLVQLHEIVDSIRIES